ncbi:MAG: hypothetical protein QM775_31010 [Pirellulales bacterium]
MLLRVTASAFNDRGPLFMEQALGAVHEGITSDNTVTLKMARSETGVTLFIALPNSLRPLIEGQLLSHYPSARIERVAEASVAPGPGDTLWLRTLTVGPAIQCIRSYTDFVDPQTRLSADPLGGIMTAVSGADHDPLRTCLEITIRPAAARRVRTAKWAVRQLSRPRLAHSSVWRCAFLSWSFLARRWKRAVARIAVRMAGPRQTGEQQRDEVTIEKLDQRLFESQIQLSVSGPASTARRARAKLGEVVAALGQFSDPQHASFHVSPLASIRSRSRVGDSLLTAGELATLWHLPTVNLEVPSLDTATHRRLPPPLTLPNPQREEGTAF